MSPLSYMNQYQLDIEIMQGMSLLQTPSQNKEWWYFEQPLCNYDLGE